MSLALVPVEIKKLIVNFIHPSNMTCQEVKNCGRFIVNLSLINKEFKGACAEKIENLKKIQALIIKYSVYNCEYAEDLQARNLYWVKKKYKARYPGGNPQLLDALLTGSHFICAKHRFAAYTPEIENDIKTIIALTPQSMNCILGKLRCWNYVPPLAMACINKEIPLHMIDFLLENGANPNATFDEVGTDCDILQLLKGFSIDSDRVAAIKELFKKCATN
jgi:hypothetical protein